MNLDELREKFWGNKRVPAAVEDAAQQIRNPTDDATIALPDGVRPVEVNTDEAGWKDHPDTPSYEGKSSVEEYVVDLHSFGSPLDPNSRMEWMRQLQAKIPPPDEDVESTPLPAVNTSSEARQVARDLGRSRRGQTE